MRSSHYWLLLLFLGQMLMHMARSVKESACAECGGADWIRVDDEPFCYTLLKSQKLLNFAEAKEACTKKGSANLPVLKTDKAKTNFQDLAGQKLGSSEWVFVGIAKVNAQAEWQWTDKTNSKVKQWPELSGAHIQFDAFRLKAEGPKYTPTLKLFTTEDIFCQKQCSTAGQGEGGGLGIGAIIGICVGGALLLLLLVMLAVVLVKSRRPNAMTGTETVSQTAPTTGTGSMAPAKGADEAGVQTKDLFCGTEMTHMGGGISTNDLFGASEADRTSNTSLGV